MESRKEVRALLSIDGVMIEKLFLFISSSCRHKYSFDAVSHTQLGSMVSNNCEKGKMCNQVQVEK